MPQYHFLITMFIAVALGGGICISLSDRLTPATQTLAHIGFTGIAIGGASAALVLVGVVSGRFTV
mgnify:CR=1 FL=1